MPVVQFNKDAYPYCTGDVTVLSDKELKAVDTYCEEHEIVDAYVVQGQPAEDAPLEDAGPSYKELKARAAELGLPTNGSKEGLATRIAEKEESLKDDSDQGNTEGGDTSDGDEE